MRPEQRQRESLDFGVKMLGLGLGIDDLSVQQYSRGSLPDNYITESGDNYIQETSGNYTTEAAYQFATISDLNYFTEDGYVITPENGFGNYCIEASTLTTQTLAGNNYLTETGGLYLQEDGINNFIGE